MFSFDHCRCKWIPNLLSTRLGCSVLDQQPIPEPSYYDYLYSWLPPFQNIAIKICRPFLWYLQPGISALVDNQPPFIGSITRHFFCGILLLFLLISQDESKKSFVRPLLLTASMIGLSSPLWVFETEMARPETIYTYLDQKLDAFATARVQDFVWFLKQGMPEPCMIVITIVFFVSFWFTNFLVLYWLIKGPIYALKFLTAQIAITWMRLRSPQYDPDLHIRWARGRSRPPGMNRRTQLRSPSYSASRARRRELRTRAMNIPVGVDSDE